VCLCPSQCSLTMRRENPRQSGRECCGAPAFDGPPATGVPTPSSTSWGFDEVPSRELQSVDEYISRQVQFQVAASFERMRRAHGDIGDVKSSHESTAVELRQQIARLELKVDAGAKLMSHFVHRNEIEGLREADARQERTIGAHQSLHESSERTISDSAAATDAMRQQADAMVADLRAQVSHADAMVADLRAQVSQFAEQMQIMRDEAEVKNESLRMKVAYAGIIALKAGDLVGEDRKKTLASLEREASEAVKAKDAAEERKSKNGPGNRNHANRSAALGGVSVLSPMGMPSMPTGV